VSPFHNLNAEEHVVLQNKTFNYTELLVLYVVFSHPFTIQKDDGIDVSSSCKVSGFTLYDGKERCNFIQNIC